MTRLLVLGAGYLGAAVADRALRAGDEVVAADNWRATRRGQWAELEGRGARVAGCDVRSREQIRVLLQEAQPERVVFLAAQASRPLSWTNPDYTEHTNVTGARLVAEEVAQLDDRPVVAFASSLHVHGAPTGVVDADTPYGEPTDLAHLTKVPAELVLAMHARRAPFPLALLRLGIVYGPSPVEHDAPGSVTVVDKFRRLAAAGEPLPLDDGGTATIGVVHVDDAARILHEHVPDGVEAAPVAAETLTVADVAALAEGRAAAGGATWTVDSPFAYEHDVAGHLR